MSFSVDIQNHLVKFKEETQYLPPTNPRKKWEYLEVTDNLFPPIRHGFMQYAYRDAIAFHDYARHVRSSQIFCFNLFYPLIDSGALNSFFSNRFSINIASLEEWHFEYQPQTDLLGEWNGTLKPIDYITSVDLFLLFKTKDNERIAFLIEVKFTEKDFTGCGGFSSNGNKNKAFCSSSFDISKIQTDCYLVNIKGRKYFDLTTGIYNSFNTSICPFADNNQCQRNHAFSKALTGVEKAYFGLIYHDSNTEIIREWDKYKALCTNEEQENLFEIKAGDLVLCSSDDCYKKYFKDRYLLF